MKGATARPVPIWVRGDLSQGVDTSTVRLDSQYLALDTRYPWQQVADQPDLQVRGAALRATGLGVGCALTSPPTCSTLPFSAGHGWPCAAGPAKFVCWLTHDSHTWGDC